MVEVNSMNPAVTASARWVWNGSGDSYRLMFEAFTFDKQGQHSGKIRTYLAIQMDAIPAVLPSILLKTALA